MARTDQRRHLAAIVAKSHQALGLAWRNHVDLSSPLAAKSDLLDIVPPLGDSYRLAAGALAADWYDDLRDEAEARGRFRAEPAGLVDKTRYEALIGWAVGPMFGADPDASAALSLLEGGFQRIVADGYRETITEASVRDKASQGWLRVGTGECDWCQQYIDGEVRSVAYDFPAHDRCGCVAVPVFN